jgi:hypothetical protein
MASEAQITKLQTLMVKAVERSSQPTFAKEGMSVWMKLVERMTFDALTNAQVNAVIEALTANALGNPNPVRALCIAATRDNNLAQALGVAELVAQIKQIWVKGVDADTVAAQIFPVVKAEATVYSDGLTVPSIDDVEVELVSMGEMYEWDMDRFYRHDHEDRVRRIEIDIIKAEREIREKMYRHEL